MSHWTFAASYANGTEKASFRVQHLTTGDTPYSAPISLESTAHIVMAFFIENNPSKLVGPFGSRTKCKLCEKRFFSNFCQKLHANVHRINGLKCEKSMKRCVLCNKSFEKEFVYKFHKQQFHKKPGVSDPGTTVVFPSWYVNKKLLPAKDPTDNEHRLKGTVLKKEKIPSKDIIGKYVSHLLRIFVGGEIQPHGEDRGDRLGSSNVGTHDTFLAAFHLIVLQY